ncbi:NADase-type glycan-binding domain-containing protein [Paenibacillus sp. HW567]|uniref:NADase-type glycan-binding domain-containing protein n=1 Tax=Paenibacillus sp. HW567 TaxID=1034769 RepID=UPI0003793A2F|nr:hypothetical protein [Paenibacillus sp. HW567]
MDKALVEDEDSDGTLNLTVNQQTGKAKLAYDVWDGGETYTFQSATLLTIDGQQPVKFTYKYKVYNGDGEERSASGEGSIQFKPGLIVLQMGQLPSEVDPIFTKPRSFIRDPYGNRAPKPGADFDIVAKYCNCKPSKLVKFDYPAGDNESNKEWIRYVSVYVRDIFITEYKVNLHTNTAINLKDSWSEAYQTHNQIQTSKITATSTLPKSKTSSYSPNQVMDGDSTTCWCEGVKGSGIGQSFTIQFTKTIEIEGLKILPGYGKSVSAYLENNSVRKARITFSDGSSTIVDFTKGYYFELPEIKRTNSIKFTILEVNPGSKYDDTCVTELAVF